MNRYIIICLSLFFIISCTKIAGTIEKSSGDRKDSEINWRLIGPGDADQVSAINISKKGVVYISTDIGGVYKSDDWGESWTPITKGIKNYDIVTPVLISPDDERILYIGTRGGVYKSIDGGQSWKAKWKGIGSGRPASSSLSACIGSIVFDPFDPKIIYMGMGYRPSSEGSTVVKKIKWDGGVYRSSDRGESWKVIASLGDNVMIRHIYPVTSRVIYIATNSGLFESKDAGKTWKNIFPVSSKYIISRPQTPHILYLATGESGLYRSMDSGSHWMKINEGLSLRPGNPGHRDNYTQVMVDNKNHDTLYAISTTWGVGGSVYKSMNNGDSWKKITIWPDTINRLRQGKINVDSSWLKHSRRVNTIAMDPQNNERIFIGTSRYIYKTEDSGRSWQQLISRKVSDDKWTHRGINLFGHTRVVGIDPLDPDRLYIGTADHGLVKSEDGGRSWKQSIKGMIYKDDIYDISVDAVNSSILYVINGKGGGKAAGVARSYDFGENWEQLDDGLKKTVYYTLLLDPDNSDIVYVGGNGALYVTGDGGKNWILKNRGIEQTTVRKLLFHPKDKGIIFAATDVGLFKTINAGNSWHKTHVSDMNLYSIVIDPQRESTIYAGAVIDGRRKLYGGIFKSVDGGRRWEKMLTVRRIESMAIIPAQPAIIYALSNDFQYHDESSGEGIFRSTDGGSTWEANNKGLSVLRGFNINIAPYPPYRLYLSSNGSGAYVATDPIAADNLQ